MTDHASFFLSGVTVTQHKFCLVLYLQPLADQAVTLLPLLSVHPCSTLNLCQRKEGAK